MPYEQFRRGFTLVELAIVLIIIGLVVGGVLAGRSLIHEYEIRKVISDIRSYETATHAFVTKYGKLPGDIPNPGNYGLTVGNPYDLTYGFSGGNGNGQLESQYGLLGSLSGGYNNTYISGEITLFWTHLGDAGLIGGHYTGIEPMTNPPIAWATIPGITTPIIYRSKGLIAYTSTDGDIYFATGLDGYKCDTTSPQNDCTNPTFTANEANAIDKKIDDGMPLTGNVMTWTGSGSGNVTMPVGSIETLTPASQCINGITAAAIYYQNDFVSSCNLHFRMQR